MLCARRFLLIPILAGAVGVATAADASERVEVTAQVVQSTENGTFVDVQFRITVSNGESSAVSNVFVVFDDGAQVSLGEIAAEESGVSEPETRSIEASTIATRHVSLPVTVKFAVNGANVEVARTLFLHLGAPAQE